MSGRNFGDERLFFLAESLAYNQTAEEVHFTTTGITAEGIKAFNGILQSNIALKSLNLSGNPIGDEEVKGFSSLAGAILENKIVLSIYLKRFAWCSCVGERTGGKQIFEGAPLFFSVKRLLICLSMHIRLPWTELRQSYHVRIWFDWGRF